MVMVVLSAAIGKVELYYNFSNLGFMKLSVCFYEYVAIELHAYLFVLMPIPNSAVNVTPLLSTEYSLVPVPTKVCCTVGACGCLLHVMGVLLSCDIALRSCMTRAFTSCLFVSLVIQEQRERLASQSSALSNCGDDMYATLNESIGAVSILSVLKESFQMCGVTIRLSSEQ